MTNDKQRERLVELLKDVEYQYTKINSITTENVADWLLRHGIIVPPCKVGDVVKHDAIYYEAYRMEAYSDFDTPTHYRYWAEPINDEGEDDFWFWSDRVEDGTVVVCSKEEAEQALNNVQNGNSCEGGASDAD